MSVTLTPSTAGAGCCVILACSCFNKAEHFAPFPWAPVRHQAVHIRQQDLINSHVTATYEITAPPWTRDPAELTVQPPLIKCIRHRLWELVTLAYIHSAPAEVKVTDNNAYLDRLWLSAASQLCPAPLCPYPSPCLAHFSLFTLIVGHGPDSCPSTPPVAVEHWITRRPVERAQQAPGISGERISGAVCADWGCGADHPRSAREWRSEVAVEDDRPTYRR